MLEINLTNSKEPLKKVPTNSVPGETTISPPNIPWQVQFKDAFKTTKALSLFLGRKLPETNYPILVPRRLAKLIRKSGPNSPLWNQFVPSSSENFSQALGMEDPIGDHKHAVPAQLVHRYENRALFMPTTACPVNCRYCFRKNELANPDQIFTPDFEKTLTYLSQHPEIEEIIYSGGDPFILSTEKLKYSLHGFTKIKSLKYLRFHTRVPSILPERFCDEELLNTLSWAASKFETLSLVVHINHTDEIDHEVENFFKVIKKLNIQVLTQTVLLRDVNDDVETLKNLFLKITKLGARPYYLHHPDLVKGAMHFHLSLTEGRYLWSALKKVTPSWALPRYVIDIPGGHGKTEAYNSESFEFSGKLLDKDGELRSYIASDGPSEILDS